ncbi:terminase [Calidifontibacter indicus]|uniref:Phage terminase small subunit n=1 Tax=Calidifontibacter indicus TaxID=419650 RepID=A0A3D9UMG2_9MICO|nr:terminase [Calidifontibacter indicus]REF30642.1 hypothetical protein DFJ65_1657 [Calidifontibacter indicus]
MTTQKPPSGLSAPGAALWAAITSEYELAQHELAVLLEACRTVDVLQQLDDLVRTDGVTNTSPQGVRAHPALVEARQQRLTLAKLFAALAIPADVDTAARGRLKVAR